LVIIHTHDIINKECCLVQKQYMPVTVCKKTPMSRNGRALRNLYRQHELKNGIH